MAGLLIALAAVFLTACGSSSSSGAGTTSAKTTAQAGSASSRSAALRECLKKAGVTLPSAPSGSPGSGGPPSGGAGGFKPPEGTSGSKFQEAIKKCGGNFPAGGRGNVNSASAKAALTKYTSCMRENGVNLPAANTSGTGPVFSTKGIDTSSQSFKSAQKACQSDLKGAFGAGGGAPPSGGSPPSGAEGPPGGENGAPPGAEGAQG